MGGVCPITNRQVDIRGIRIGALLILTCVVATSYTGNWWIFWLLGLDFFIRGFTTLPVSPIALAAQAICKIIGPGQKQNAGPKIFAAKIGFTFSMMIAIVSHQGFFFPATIMAAMFSLCAALEGFIGICVACYFYQFVCNQGEVKP